MILLGIKPARGLCYIRRIEAEDTYRGGKIIITPKSQAKITAQQFEVVSVGDYERCPDPEECNRPHTKRGEHRHHLHVSDWVLCKNRSWSHTPDPDVYVVRQSDVLGVFREG